MYDNTLTQNVQDAKALAHVAVRAAIKLAYAILASMGNPTVPSSSTPEASEKLPNDPTGKTGIAGGAHELSEGSQGTVDEVLETHEEAHAPASTSKPMERIDGAAYHTLLHKVPDEYRPSFKPFEQLILDPESDEEQPPIVLDEFDQKDRADVQLGTGLALIDLESILRA